jgi:four helix bundle protein
LLKEGSGVGVTVLKNLDVDIKNLRLDVEKLVEKGPNAVTMGKLPPTPGAKKVIEYAVQESRALNHNYVGTEHILLGLLREGEGIAAQVLMNLGLRLEEVRDELLRLLGTAEGPAPLSAGAEEPGVASYKDLPVWQKADELARQVYAVTDTFPQDQISRVAFRLRKMALAIPPRIADAHSRRAPSEVKRLLNAAFASLRELRYLLDLAKRLETLKAEDYQNLNDLAEELDKLLCAFYGSLGGN